MSAVNFRASGALRQLNYGNGRRLTMGYNDNRNQPTSMKVDRTNNAADKVVDYAYQYYDANGKNNNRIRQITDNIETAYSTSYLYDDYNRLTNATANAFSRSYSYDEWGNVKNFSGLTLTYATNGSGAPSTNRLLSDSQGGSYTYDAAGNQTAGAGQSYSYDGANRLKEVGTGGANVYGYDGDGKRVKKTEGGATTYYIYSSKLGQSVMEISANSVQRVFVYSGSKLVAMQATDGQFYWLHTNHLGNSRAMTDGSGNLTYKGQFDPYGASLTEWSASGNTNLNNKKFTGYERDTSGLDYANARMYNSARGRFQTPDPIGLKAANQKRPQTLNLYSYVANDPVNNTDPSGLLLANPDEDPSSPCSFTVWGWNMGDGWISVVRGFWNCPSNAGTSGGGGSGTSPQQPVIGQRVPLAGAKLVKYNEARDRLIHLITDITSQCAELLLEAFGMEDGNGFNIAEELLRQRAFDGDLSTIDTQLAGVSPYWAGVPINQFLGGQGAATASNASPLFGSTPRDVYYTAAAIDVPTILHETLHHHLKLHDGELRDRLGVSPADYQAKGSQSITDHLAKGGCK